LTTTKIPSACEPLLEQGCPYCCGMFSEAGHGEHGYGVSNYMVDTYTCLRCQEVFEIHKKDDEEVSFLFSCNGVYVRCIFDEADFFVSTSSDLLYSKNGLTTPTVQIPRFVIDFSDKEKLHNKLRVYIIFS
jgi:hypothetical protein